MPKQEVLTEERQGQAVGLGHPTGGALVRQSGGLQQVDLRTGELREVGPYLGSERPVSLRDEIFAKMGSKPVPKTIQKILDKPFDGKTQIEILPTGEVYVPQGHIRARLTAAFGSAGWSLRPLVEYAFDPIQNQMYREWALIAHGRVIATAVGSAKYHPDNARQDYADAAESAKSNALTRASKDLGLGGLQAWDRRFCDAWKDKYAVHVWMKSKKRDGTLYVDAVWRRIDAKPFQGEFAVVTNSPNRSDKSVSILPDVDNFSRAKSLASMQTGRPSEPEPPTRDDVEREVVRAQQQTNAGGESSQARPHTTQAPSQVDPTLRAHLIKECRILKKFTDGSALHLVKMMDGAEYTTFDTKLYDAANRAWAGRLLVDVVSEKKTNNGKTFKNIVEMVAHKP